MIHDVSEGNCAQFIMVFLITSVCFEFEMTAGQQVIHLIGLFNNSKWKSGSRGSELQRPQN